MKNLLLILAFVATPAYAYVQVDDQIDITDHIVCEYAETMYAAFEAYAESGKAGATAVWRAAVAMGHCSLARGGVTVLEVVDRLGGIAIVRTDHAKHSYTIATDTP
jgi:hypothetical protein